MTLRAVEFHHPYTTIEELAPLAERTVFVPYLALEKQTRFGNQLEYWRWLVANTDCRFWFPATADTPEMSEFIAGVAWT